MARVAAWLLFIALAVGSCRAQTSLGDELQQILSGVSAAASPTAQQLGSDLLQKYQQTVQSFLTGFTATANTAGSLQEKVNSLVTSEAANVVGNTESLITQLVNAAQAASSQSFLADLPVIGQVANGLEYIELSAQSAVTQLQQLYDDFDSAYCTPAVYTPPADVPANLTGPGFSLTFSLGNCTFDATQLLSPDGAIQCVGPSAMLDTTPATFTSAYKSAATFTGQQCEVSQSFGESTTEILYVFDPKTLLQQNMPLQAISEYLQQQLAAVLDGLGIPGLASEAQSLAAQAVSQAESTAATYLAQAETVAAPYIREVYSVATPYVDQIEAAMAPVLSAIQPVITAITPPLLASSSPTAGSSGPSAAPALQPAAAPTAAAPMIASPVSPMSTQTASPMPIQTASPMPAPLGSPLPPLADTAARPAPAAAAPAPAPLPTVVIEVPSASLSAAGR